jgi:hypothetical protein
MRVFTQEDIAITAWGLQQLHHALRVSILRTSVVVHDPGGTDMLLKNCAAFAVLLTGFLMGPVLLGAPQQELLNRSFPEVSQHIYVWDSIHKILIFARDATQGDTTAPILAYHAKTTPVSISPLNDFQGAASISFWGISGAPNGAVITSTTVVYGPGRVRHLILTYDEKGKLIKVWDVFPYLFNDLAVDSKGNVYGFGGRLEKSDDDADGDYALLVAYSPEGKVLWESLPRSSFPWGTEVISGSRNNSNNQVMISGDGLLLYAAAKEEFLRFDLAGKLLGRFPMATLLSRIAGGRGVSAHFWSLSLTGSGAVIGQVQLRPITGPGDIKFQMVELQSDLVNWRPLTPFGAGVSLGRLLGTGDDGKLLFFARDSSGNSVLTSTYIP